MPAVSHINVLQVQLKENDEVQKKRDETISPQSMDFSPAWFVDTVSIFRWKNGNFCKKKKKYIYNDFHIVFLNCVKSQPWKSDFYTSLKHVGQRMALSGTK